MKKLLIVLLCAGLAVSETACGSGAGSGPGASASEKSEVTASDGEEEGGAADGSAIAGEASTAAESVTAGAGDETAAAADAAVSSAETDPKEPEWKGLDPSVHYQEGEVKAADTDLYSLTVTGYDPACHYEEIDPDTGEDYGYDCFAVNFRFENKSDRLFRYLPYGIEGIAVNRNEVLPEIVPEQESAEEENADPFVTEFEVGAGETMNGRFQIKLSDLEEAGITSVDELIVYFTGELLEGTEGVEDAYVYEMVYPYAAIYPTGKKAEEILPAGEIKKEDLTVIAETEDFLFGALPGGYTVSEEENDPVALYFQNKSDRTIGIEISDIYVNGIKYYEEEEEEDSETGLTYRSRLGTAAPGCHFVSYFGNDEIYFLEENGFDSVSELSGTLTAYEYKEDPVDDENMSLWMEGGAVFYEEPFSWKADG